MKKIQDRLTYKNKDEIHCWVFDTTRSDLIGYPQSQKLEAEISNWDLYKLFVEKYGLILSNPDDYVLIFIINYLAKGYKILCHPDCQDEESILNSLDIPYNEVKWIYEEIIYHDEDFNHTVDEKGFKHSEFVPKNDTRNLLQIANDLFKNRKPTSRIFNLSSFSDIHHSVICGGNGDVLKCQNYFGYVNEQHKVQLLELLSLKNKPSFEDVLKQVDFFIVDYKGEDIGYSRLLKIYSRFDLKSQIDTILIEFRSFQIKLIGILIKSETLKELETSLNGLSKEYGC